MYNYADLEIVTPQELKGSLTIKFPHKTAQAETESELPFNLEETLTSPLIETEQKRFTHQIVKEWSKDDFYEQVERSELCELLSLEALLHAYQEAYGSDGDFYIYAYHLSWIGSFSERFGEQAMREIYESKEAEVLALLGEV